MGLFLVQGNDQTHNRCQEVIIFVNVYLLPCQEKDSGIRLTSSSSTVIFSPINLVAIFAFLEEIKFRYYLYRTNEKYDKIKYNKISPNYTNKDVKKFGF